MMSHQSDDHTWTWLSAFMLVGYIGGCATFGFFDFGRLESKLNALGVKKDVQIAILSVEKARTAPDGGRLTRAVFHKQMSNLFDPPLASASEGQANALRD